MDFLNYERGPEEFLGKGVLKMLQVYRRTPMPKSDFNKVA